MKTLLKSLLLLMLICSPPLMADEKIPFQPQDIFKLRSAANPLISPDGSRIIYLIFGIDVANDMPSSETWIMNADGSDKRQLLKDGGGVVWSPDGSQIAYIAPDDNEKAQIFLLDMNQAAAPVKVSDIDQSPSGLSWSPDGKSIAFFSFVPQDSPWQIDLPVEDGKPEGAKWSEEPLVIDRLNFRQDRVGYLPYGHDHISVISVETGEVRQLTKGNWPTSILIYGSNRNFIAWHASGKSLYFSATMDEAHDSLYEGYLNQVNLKTGKMTRVSREEGTWTAPKVSPDGKYIAYIGFDKAPRPVYQMQELWVSKTDGNERRRVSGDLDDTVFNFFWAKDSKTLYFNLAKQGQRQIYRTTIDSKPERLTEGAHVLTPTSMSDEGIIVGTRMSGLDPSEVFIFDPRKPEKRKQLTHHNDWLYEDRDRGEFRSLIFTSEDGTAVQGFFQLPPNFNPETRYPLLLWVHGGPYSAYGQIYQETVDYLAGRGYVVGLINYRTTVGYGTEFVGGVTGGFPGKEDFQDIMAGVDAVLAEGYVDPDRLFIAGCSAGGMETAWVVGHTDRFRAAVTMCTSVNPISAAGTSDYAIWVHRHRNKPFWEDPSEWLAHSSLMYVGNVKTPTAVFVGEHDTATPVGQSEEFYRALKLAGVPTRLVLFKDEWHWFVRPVNKIRMIEYMLDWFRQYDPAMQ